MFTRSLIRSEREVEYSEEKARIFIDFLIDECMDIFNVPDDLKVDIESSLVCFHFNDFQFLILFSLSNDIIFSVYAVSYQTLQCI